MEYKTKYRVKFDGQYVQECDFEYLVECDEKESVFSESSAMSMKKQCPTRVEIYKIIDQEYMDHKYKKGVKQNENKKQSTI